MSSEVDTFMFFKWFFKAWVAVLIVAHTFDITMVVFDVAQHIVSGAAGVIHGSTAINIDAAINTHEPIVSRELWERVQARWDAIPRKQRRVPYTENIFKGRIFCGHLRLCHA